MRNTTIQEHGCNSQPSVCFNHSIFVSSVARWVFLVDWLQSVLRSYVRRLLWNSKSGVLTTVTSAGGVAVSLSIFQALGVCFCHFSLLIQFCILAMIKKQRKD